MHVVLVYVHVNKDDIEAFKAASLENARSSLKEPGVRRFDLLQQADDPRRFVLVEAYLSEADQTAHRATAHYLKWRDSVAEMMAEPRVGVIYTSLHPDDADW